jgi:hypothetical protein
MTYRFADHPAVNAQLTSHSGYAAHAELVLPAYLFKELHLLPPG